MGFGEGLNRKQGSFLANEATDRQEMRGSNCGMSSTEACGIHAAGIHLNPVGLCSQLNELMTHRFGYYNENFGNGEEIDVAVSESIKSSVLIGVKPVKYHYQRNVGETTGWCNTCTKRTIFSEHCAGFGVLQPASHLMLAPLLSP
jgi:hypothetical protein